MLPVVNLGVNTLETVFLKEENCILARIWHELVNADEKEFIGFIYSDLPQLASIVLI